MVGQIIQNWTPGIIQSFIGSVAFAVVLLIFPKARKALNDVAKWVNSKRYNPSLKIIVSLGGDLEDEATQREFENSVTNSLKRKGYSILPTKNGKIIFKREFETFSVDSEIVSSYSPGSEENNIDHFTIILRSDNIKLKSLKESLFEIQTYLFKDLLIDISNNLRFFPVKQKESIEVVFEKPPIMLNSVKDLNINHLSSKDMDLQINLFPNKMSVHGDIEKSGIERIEFLVQKNLLA